MFVKLQGLGGLHVFFKHTICVKYKCREIHEIWVVAVLVFNFGQLRECLASKNVFEIV